MASEKKTAPRVSAKGSVKARSGKTASASKTASSKPKPSAARKAAPSSRKAGHSTSPRAKKRRSRKKSSLNMPLIMALLTIFILGGAGIYWMVSNKASGPGIGAGLTVERAAEPKGKPEAKDLAARDGLNEKDKHKPQVGLPKVEPVTPAKEERGVAKPAPEKYKAPPSAVQPLPGAPRTGAGEALKPQEDREAGQEFETTLGGAMERNTKLIDSYLLGVLIARGYSGDNIKIVGMERRTRPGDSYYFQKLRVELPENSYYYKHPGSFMQDVSRGFKALRANAEIVRQTETHYLVSVNGLPTHEIILHLLRKMGPPPPETAVPAGKEALLAIVIDDVGESVSAAQTLVNLDFPVTLAIWPRSSNARKCGEMGHAKGLEIMIHQPMEPLEYPKVKPGPGAVFTSMRPEKVTSVVEANIAMVPYAVGLNNHMGSRFTQNRRGLEAVLTAMRGKNLFVLDSVTHGSTIFYDLALEEGFPSQRRDIFLDVTHDKNAVLHQLRKSEALARSQGYAIAIGHPLPQTLQALKEWQGIRNKDVKIVRVQDLLNYRRPANGQAKK